MAGEYNNVCEGPFSSVVLVCDAFFVFVFLLLDCPKI